MDMSKVNEATLTALGACEDGKEWFVNNIKELDVSMITKISGEYNGYIRWLKNKYIDTVFEFDDFGNVVYEENKINGTWSRITRDEKGYAIKIEDSYSEIYHYKYDDAGNCIYMGRDHSDGYRSWTKSEYTTSGKLRREEESDGFWQEWSYDEHDQCVLFKDSDDFTQEFKYDKNGNVIYEKNSNDELYHYKYDDTGNCVETHTPTCNFTRQSKYDKNGNCVEESTSTGYWYKFAFDSKGNQISYDDYRSNSWERTYIIIEDGFTQTLNGEVEVFIPFK